MTTSDLFLGKGDTPQTLSLRYANRHGLVAGATGTGKTVTLQSLTEAFSDAGVPVFLADVKGDLAGISQPGSVNPNLIERARELALENYQQRGFPTIFWDLFGRQGHPVRTTVSDFGPLLLSRLLELNDAQQGVLNIVFRIADEQGLLLLDLKDLRAMLQYVAEQASTLTTQYGNVSKASVGAIQRQLLSLEQQGAEHLFGEPALDLVDLMRTTRDGRGYVSILAADQLMRQPNLYATFLLWLLAELFEELPEAGDLDKPNLVFFFDEAHLLFDNAPKALIDQVEQVVRLIRSKGVGIYFVSQSPLDIPEDVLGQLGNRIQHALRAFTSKDQKAVRAAAQTFRSNPKLDAAIVLTELRVGEALVSTLREGGVPSIVERTLISPPASRLGPVTEAERRQVLDQSPVRGRYEPVVDRASAYEMLKQKADITAGTRPSREVGRTTRRSSGGHGTDLMETMTKSLVRSIGSSLGRKIMRGVLGSILRGR
jgi:hypothetical protein